MASRNFFSSLAVSWILALAVGCGGSTSTSGGNGDSGSGKSDAGPDARPIDSGRDAASNAPHDASDGDAGVPSCDAYCAAILNNCTGNDLEYESKSSCFAICKAWPPGALADRSGDTVGCRLHEALQAAVDPGAHCKTAGPLGGGVCGKNPCANFCELNFAFCLPPSQHYASEAMCEAECGGFKYAPDGDATQSSGGTLNCHVYYLEKASAPSEPGGGGATNCLSVGPGSPSLQYNCN